MISDAGRQAVTHLETLEEGGHVVGFELGLDELERVWVRRNELSDLLLREVYPIPSK